MSLRSVVLLAILVPAFGFADFVPSTWKFRKRLPVESGKPISSVHVDRQVYAKASQFLDDIRIVRGSEEVPYLVTRMSGSRENKQIDAEILDRSALGESVQFVLELPSNVARHSRVNLATNQSNFRKKVKIEASTDRKSWALVRKEAYIFDFTYEAQHSSILSVEYPVSTRRYLRVTIEGWQDPAVLTGAGVSLAEDRPPVRQIVQEFKTLSPVEDPKTKSTSYVLDFGETGVPKDLLRFELQGEAMFHRAVEIEVSEDPAKGWSPHARGVIFRITGEQSLWIQLQDTRARYFRIRIFHGDDQPVPVRSVTAESIIRRVIFPVREGADYWMYYGNSAAKPPAYDLPMVLARSSIESASTINAAAQEANPGYIEPPTPAKPFSDRHPELLYAILGVAVLAIGYMTVRFLQKASVNS
jgi:hypothetical protein